MVEHQWQQLQASADSAIAVVAEARVHLDIVAAALPAT